MDEPKPLEAVIKEVLEIAPLSRDKVYAIHCDHVVSIQERANLLKAWEAAWGEDHPRAIVFDQGYKLGVLATDAGEGE